MNKKIKGNSLKNKNECHEQSRTLELLQTDGNQIHIWRKSLGKIYSLKHIQKHV
jgi:hypothetical protein